MVYKMYLDQRTSTILQKNAFLAKLYSFWNLKKVLADQIDEVRGP